MFQLTQPLDSRLSTQLTCAAQRAEREGDHSETAVQGRLFCAIYSEWDNEFHSILKYASWTHTLTLSSLLATRQSELLLYHFVKGGCLFPLLCKWRQTGWVVVCKKLKLDTLVLCLPSEAAAVIYLSLHDVISHGVKQGNCIFNCCGKTQSLCLIRLFTGRGKQNYWPTTPPHTPKKEEKKTFNREISQFTCALIQLQTAQICANISSGPVKQYIN